MKSLTLAGGQTLKGNGTVKGMLLSDLDAVNPRDAAGLQSAEGRHGAVCS